MPDPGPPFLMDVPALKEWADASGNEFKIVADGIQSGDIAIFNRVWAALKEAYADEAAVLAKTQMTKHRFKQEHRLAAAAIADKLSATFPLMSGAYDDAIEWVVTGIAVINGYTIVTDERRKAKYTQIDGVAAVTYEEMLDLL